LIKPGQKGILLPDFFHFTDIFFGRQNQGRIMVTIESYTFGKMMIQGRIFTSDLIIFPDQPGQPGQRENRIQANWIRKSGHVLESCDIKDLIMTNPELIIAGTGAHGRMVIDKALERDLKIAGIKLLALPTKEAVEAFNQCTNGKTATGACFHLTC